MLPLRDAEFICCSEEQLVCDKEDDERLEEESQESLNSVIDLLFESDVDMTKGEKTVVDSEAIDDFQQLINATPHLTEKVEETPSDEASG